MSIIGRVRGILAVAYFLVIVGFLAAPHFFLILAWHRLARFVGRADDRARRIRVAAWEVTWANAIFAGVRAILGFEVDFRLPLEPQGTPKRPLIVVSNHVSMLDMLLIAALLSKTGRRDLRWIMAEERRRDPFIPWACSKGGSVFVRRDGDPSARDEVDRCATLADEDGASIVIFPEGTRFRGPKPGSGYTRVLPPRAGGFSILRSRLPDRAVLSITIRWEGRGGGVGLGEVGNYSGRRLVMETRLIGRIEGMSDRDFLDDDFRRKEAVLVQTG